MNAEVMHHLDKALTPIQEETLNEIKKFKNKKGFYPTMQELAEILNIKKPSVYERINHLVKKGYLSKQPRKVRSLVVLESASNENNVEGEPWLK